MLRNISPHAVAFAANTTPKAIRAWRHRNIISGFGSRQGKGHKFTRSEAVCVAWAVTLSRHGASFQRAFDFVWQHARMIDGLIAIADHRNELDRILSIAVDAGCDSCTLLSCEPSDRTSPHLDQLATVRVNFSLLVRSVSQRIEQFQAQ